MLLNRSNLRGIIFSGSVWLALSGFLAYVGYFAMYSTFAPFDDEGYWLISLRSYQLHGSLYHETYAQAGPFYYEAWSLLYSVFGLSVNWDTGRGITLAVWIATSLLFGIAIWILSKHILLGLLAETVSFLVLFLLAGVSMDPSGLAHLLGAVVLLGIAIVVRGHRRAGFGIVGVASTALLFTKVNIGIFVMTGMIAAVSIYWPSRRWVFTRKLAAILILLLAPVLLMAPVLDEHWVRSFCVLELLYVVGLAGIVVTRKDSAQPFATRDIAFGLVAVLGSAIVITMGVLINGTSLAQLIHGATFGQRDLGQVFQIPLPATTVDLVVAAISAFVAVSIAAYTAKRDHWPGWLNSVGSGYLRFAIGIWILLTICGSAGGSPNGLVLAPTLTIPIPGQAFLLAAPFAWVAALGGERNEDGGFGFGRVAICLIGVLGCLEAFPAAGSPFWWGALTMVPVGILCISDGLSMMSPLQRGLRWAARGVLKVPLGSLVVMGLALFLLLGNVGQVLAHYRTGYYANEPLSLSGAGSVTLPPPQVQGLRTVTLFLKTNCSTFWSLPGLNSFYLFSGETPPTGLNTTEWFDLLDVKQQDEVLTRLRHTSRLCLVEGISAFDLGHLVKTPLVRFLERDFVLVKAVGGYQLLVRSSLLTG